MRSRDEGRRTGTQWIRLMPRCKMYGNRGRMTLAMRGALADFRIVRDGRMEGQGIQSTLEEIADSSGRLG